MDRCLTAFACGWAGLLIAANLAAMFIIGDDAGARFGIGMAANGVGLLSSLRAAAVHAGYLAGNVIGILPAVAAIWWRDRRRSRKPV